MESRRIVLSENVLGLASVLGVVPCLSIVGRECLVHGTISAVAATVLILVGQFAFSHVSWSQIIITFPLVLAFVGTLLVVNRCFGHELTIVPRQSVLLRYFWRREHFKVEDIVSVSCDEKKGGWMVLEFVVRMARGPRVVEFVAKIPKGGRDAVVDALGGHGA